MAPNMFIIDKANLKPILSIIIPQRGPTNVPINELRIAE